MSHPETWAKKKDSLGGTYVSPRDVGTQKKQDPLGGTYVSPRDVGKKTRPMWGRRDSMSPLLRDKQYPVPFHWVKEGLIDAPPLLRGDMEAYPMSPQLRRKGLIVAPPSNLPLLRRHRSSSHVPLRGSSHAPPIKKN